MQEKEIFEEENNKLAYSEDLENNELSEEQLSQISEETIHNYLKMHTPWRRRNKKVYRNDICPYCNSGLKFKKCECYEKEKSVPKYTINNG